MSSIGGGYRCESSWANRGLCWRPEGCFWSVRGSDRDVDRIDSTGSGACGSDGGRRDASTRRSPRRTAASPTTTRPRRLRRLAKLFARGGQALAAETPQVAAMNRGVDKPQTWSSGLARAPGKFRDRLRNAAASSYTDSVREADLRDHAAISGADRKLRQADR
jgi:hypothetical protein